MDVLTKKQRSFNMSRIRSNNTGQELKIRRLLFKKGIRSFRLKNNLFGKPDIVFPRSKIAVFLDGCFWHHCSACFIGPATRKDFWSKKIMGNIKRDIQVNIKLRDRGWDVLRIWEHEINKNPEKVAEYIIRRLQKIGTYQAAVV